MNVFCRVMMGIGYVLSAFAVGVCAVALIWGLILKFPEASLTILFLVAVFGVGNAILSP